MEMTNRIDLSVVRKTVLLLSILCLTAFEAEAEEYGQRFAQAVTPRPVSAREFFIGRWTRYGGDPFFPDPIVFEADPESGDRLLVTFTLGCQYQAPACSATKFRSEPVGGQQMVHVPWFKDSAGNVHNVQFQTQAGTRLVKGASKEISAYFSITPHFNRIAYFAGTERNSLRYYISNVITRPPVPGMHLNIAPR